MHQYLLLLVTYFIFFRKRDANEPSPAAEDSGCQVPVYTFFRQHFVYREVRTKVLDPYQLNQDPDLRFLVNLDPDLGFILMTNIKKICS